MAVSIRLKRLGKKKKPVYRIVIADQRNQRDGKIIENIGTYNPTIDPIECTINQDRASYWISVGAQPTKTVQRLFANAGIVKAVKRTSSQLGVTKKDRKKSSSED